MATDLVLGVEHSNVDSLDAVPFLHNYSHLHADGLTPSNHPARVCMLSERDACVSCRIVRSRLRRFVFSGVAR